MKNQKKQAKKEEDPQIIKEDDSFISQCKIFYEKYSQDTEQRIQLMDAFILYCAFLIINQFVYSILVGFYPYNSFLAGVFAPLGCLVLTANLRFQINKQTKYMSISDSKAFWEYLFCVFIMFLSSINYLG